MSGGCLEGVWRVSGRCLEGVWRVQIPNSFGIINFLGHNIFLGQMFFYQIFISDQKNFAPQFFLPQTLFENLKYLTHPRMDQAQERLGLSKFQKLQLDEVIAPYLQSSIQKIDVFIDRLCSKWLQSCCLGA